MMCMLLIACGSYYVYSCKHCCNATDLNESVPQT